MSHYTYVGKVLYHTIYRYCTLRYRTDGHQFLLCTYGTVLYCCITVTTSTTSPVGQEGCLFPFSARGVSYRCTSCAPEWVYRLGTVQQHMESLAPIKPKEKVDGTLVRPHMMCVDLLILPSCIIIPSYHLPLFVLGIDQTTRTRPACL